MASLVEARLASAEASSLEVAARPLLRVMQFITGLESTFITEIDWDRDEQDVLYSLNIAELQIAEGGTTPWSDTMCKLAFEADSPVLTDVMGDYSDSVGATDLLLRTYVALPIVGQDRTIGSVCGASRRSVTLSSEALAQMRNISEALSRLMDAEIAAARDRERAMIAELQALQARQDASEYAELAAQLEGQALTDPLTGLGNRRAFETVWEQETANAQREGYPIAVHAIDIDEFKQVNDSYGHAGGDAVICAVGDAIREITRVGDVAFRLGGDEFLLVTPRARMSSAMSIAERLRASFARISRGLGMPASISVGVASTEATPMLGLVDRADEALYQCKRSGRNRVVEFG